MKNTNLHIRGTNTLELLDKQFEQGKIKSKLTRATLLERYSEINTKIRERSPIIHPRPVKSISELAQEREDVFGLLK